MRQLGRVAARIHQFPRKFAALDRLSQPLYQPLQCVEAVGTALGSDAMASALKGYAFLKIAGKKQEAPRKGGFSFCYGKYSRATGGSGQTLLGRSHARLFVKA